MARTILALLALASLALMPAASAGCIGNGTLCTDEFSYTDGECGTSDGWGSGGRWSSLTATTDDAQASLSTSDDCYTWMGEGSGYYGLSLYASAAGQGGYASYSESTEYHGTPDDVTRHCAVSAATWGAVNHWVFQVVPAPVCGNVPHAYVPNLLP